MNGPLHSHESNPIKNLLSLRLSRIWSQRARTRTRTRFVIKSVDARCGASLSIRDFLFLFCAANLHA